MQCILHIRQRRLLPERLLSGKPLTVPYTLSASSSLQLRQYLNNKKITSDQLPLHISEPRDYTTGALESWRKSRSTSNPKHRTPWSPCREYLPFPCDFRPAPPPPQSCHGSPSATTQHWHRYYQRARKKALRVFLLARLNRLFELIYKLNELVYSSSLHAIMYSFFCFCFPKA